jgi:hypothetical protein
MAPELSASQEHVEDARADQARDADSGEHLVRHERDEDEGDHRADAAQNQRPGLVMVAHPEVQPGQRDEEERQQQRNQNRVIEMKPSPTAETIDRSAAKPRQQSAANSEPPTPILSRCRLQPPPASSVPVVIAMLLSHSQEMLVEADTGPVSPR